MAVEVFGNDGVATVSSGGTDAPSAGTSESWTLTGSTLPAASSSGSPPTQFYVADQAAGSQSELILVTNISGSTATVTRGADGTTPVTHDADFVIQQTLGRASYEALQGPITTEGDLVVGGTSGVPQRLAAGTSGYVLTAQGADEVPEWAAATGGFSNPMTTEGDVIVGGASGTAERLAAGTSGYVLTSQGSGALPEWAAASGGFSNPMTTEGDLIVGGTSGAAGRLAAGTSGYVLTAHGSGEALTWAAASGGGNVTELQPSGDATGAADTTAINDIISAGGSAVLAFTGTGTPFYVNAPLTPSTGASLKGAMPWSATTYDSYGPGTGNLGGTIIRAVAGFTGAAVVNLSNATSTQYYGVSLADFTVDCSLITASGVHGILIDGAWGAGFIEGVMVFNPGGDCLHFATDSTTNYVPDDWHVFRCKFSASYGGYGVYADNIPDSWFTDCEASENQLDNWYLNWSTNTALVRCKGENSAAGAGFHLGGLGGAGDVLSMTACTTHLNYEDGFLFDATAYEPSAGSYILANCFALADNQASGTTYAAYRSNGCPAVIQATGCYAAGAYYGASQVTSGGGMVFTGSSLSGTGAATHDDGSGTLRLLNQVPVQAYNTVADAEQYVALTTTYTLSSTSVLQKLFNATTSGALTVAASTSYFFECQFDLSSLGTGPISFGFGGTATLTSVKYTAMTQKSGALTTPAAAQLVEGTAAAATALVASTSTTGLTTATSRVKGIVRVNATGTLIPEVALTAAAAAVVGTNSFFRIWPVGTNTTTNMGNWS